MRIGVEYTAKTVMNMKKIMIVSTKKMVNMRKLSTALKTLNKVVKKRKMKIVTKTRAYVDLGEDGNEVDDNDDEFDNDEDDGKDSGGQSLEADIEHN